MTAVHDPLSGTDIRMVGTAILLLAASFVPRLGRRLPLWLRGLIASALFVGLTLLVQNAIGSPLHPRLADRSGRVLLWAQLVEAGWWMIAARAAIAIARLLIRLEHRPRETRMVSDLLAGGITIAATLAIVSFAFEVPIRGLLATSGVIAIVLGLALQSTLADVFSGIAVGIERPYRAGDLVRIEGGIEGHVVQINWRSTHIATGNNDIAVVPNSVVAKSRIVNLSAPTPMRGETIGLALDAAASPAHCMDVLDAAIRACGRILATPAPSIALTRLAGDGATYEIGFSVASSSLLGGARTELLGQVHRHLRHAGIALAVVGTDATGHAAAPDLATLLDWSDLFALLQPEDRALIAAHFRPITLDAGDALLHQGDLPTALHIIAAGTLEISRAASVSHGAGEAARSGEPHVLIRLGPGETLGAIGLMTAAPCVATAIALTQVKAYRLDKSDLADAIKRRPALAVGLEALAKRGSLAIAADAALHDDTTLAEPDQFINRLRGVLRMLSS